MEGANLDASGEGSGAAEACRERCASPGPLHGRIIRLMKLRRDPTVVILVLFTAFVAVGLQAQPLMPEEETIVSLVDRQVPRTLTLLQESVDIPSATQDLEGVASMGDFYASELQDLGFSTRWIPMPAELARAGHLIGEIDGNQGKRILLIGHLDTVLEGAGWSAANGTGHGNGAVDMKGGNAIILAALRALHDAGALDDRRIIVFFSGDEEDPGEPISISRRDMIEAAERSDAALGFEASVGDTATVARRGVTTWKLEVTGVQAHSSDIFRPENGAGAVFEAARILDRFYQELRGAKGLTFNPSVINGGTDVSFDEDAHAGSASGKTNVIARRVVATGDLRFLSIEQREAAKERMRKIVADPLPRTSATLTFTDEYPAMAPTDGNYALLGVLDQASRDLGFGPVPALDPGERGAGDVSFVAPGVDSLDGIGARGEGSHTPDETVDLESLPMLIKRTAILIYRLTR